ncbi:MAG: hypothetical protein ICV60_19335 [Pyrinomonadaceae bacterium]|nr:hypothetical protein [Pyrinomonadaceae bacterium]
MARETTNLRIMRMRALIILGVLFSLCVSNNVGPRLLPLPSLAASASAVKQVSLYTTASHLPTSDATDTFRVAIAAPANKRAGSETTPLPLAKHAPQRSLPPLGNPGRFVYSSHLVTSPSLSRPRGRAPPLSI